MADNDAVRSTDGDGIRPLNPMWVLLPIGRILLALSGQICRRASLQNPHNIWEPSLLLFQLTAKNNGVVVSNWADEQGGQQVRTQQSFPSFSNHCPVSASETELEWRRDRPAVALVAPRCFGCPLFPALAIVLGIIIDHRFAREWVGRTGAERNLLDRTQTLDDGRVDVLGSNSNPHK